MKISVNGEIIETKVTYLKLILDELGYEGNWLATAVNGEVVSIDERSQFVLHEGDRIEILTPMQGG
ncbi:Thiamine biosynthesis protein ThiS [Bartonella clarridgeiae 73]|uniref:Thiamine biosynthesis protein ThiS n=1 Tax=Bartonella clarridgeiae (strain CCUG 45776 / CIP 104772 / 73) TaxID=696125 RepID=E6YGU7_BARC7|nr:sulfur carrier protein ThiS [Bartonella clarridgeiae]WCR55324.1 MAG: Sulfur carrier protein ThiS [Bartonella clarridgeiae]CBI76085.1 Thiamine biosynthesis protein ThiS [Bartonella clarridgeiae 73]